jgi:hypothetical protein
MKEKRHRQWAAKMKEIGLQAGDTGHVGGKETGQSVSHYIIHGAPYAKAYAKLQAKGLQLHWQSPPAGQQAKVKKASKTKFTCPDCEQNAWAKPDALLGCYACSEETEELVLMLAEPSHEDVAREIGTAKTSR